MPTFETIESFPMFDPDTAIDNPTHSAAIGSTVAALGSPDALGGAGAVAIYTYSEKRNAWGYVGVLTGSRIEGVDQVRGLGAALLAVDDTLIVGARGDSGTPGRVLVLRPSYANWSFGSIATMAELGKRDPTKGDTFGSSLAYCRAGDEEYLAVGAPGAAPPAGTPGPGQVYIYKSLEAKSSPWSVSPIANPRPDGAEADKFGASVAITENPDTPGTLILAVGAPGAGPQGQVFVATTKAPGVWSPLEFAKPIEPVFEAAGDDFTISLFGTSLGAAGGILAVGSPQDPNFEKEIEGTGGVWIYDWSEGAFALSSNIYGPDADGGHGSSVAFGSGGDPEMLAVGAPAGGGGKAFRYKREAGDKTTYSLVDEYTAITGKAGDRLGYSVAVSSAPNGSWTFAGAPANPKGGQSGSGFLFAETDPRPTWIPTPAIPRLPLRWGGSPMDNWGKYSPEIPTYLS